MKNEVKVDNIGEANLTALEPVGLQYFHAVDVMVEGLHPSDGKYFNILVYMSEKKTPTVKILRYQSNLYDGRTEKQDEINLEGKKDTLQLNAECNPDGKYTQYPLQISEKGSKYLADTIESLSQILAADGSYILVNNNLRMIARGGIWLQVKKGSTLDAPQLVSSKKQLPQ